MRVTIKDIAWRTGFSVTTVSLVLNNKAPKISKETKDVIFNTAKELNYRPNQLAVGLVKKRTKTVGLIISDIRNIFFSNLAKGMEDECRNNGWTLILCNTNDMHVREKDYIHVLADKGVDGILYAMAVDNDIDTVKESIQMMRSARIPFVMVDRFLGGEDCYKILVDNFQGGYIATKHLIELGHKRIACITGPEALTDSVARLDGYKKALKEANIEFDPALVYCGNYSWEGGSQGVDYLADKDYSAIFAFNDMSAYGACKALKQNHLSIPSDISVVGYDDIFFSEILDVPLTTIHQPMYEMGVKSVQQLLRVIAKKEVEQNYIFQPTLVIRESTKKKEISEKTE